MRFGSDSKTWRSYQELVQRLLEADTHSHRYDTAIVVPFLGKAQEDMNLSLEPREEKQH
jgi:hypothetical protein